jgi:DMSO/TMAO reductase YedYZ molybdopterin-dependent catalytic subunit
VSNPFTSPQARPLTTDPRFSREELTLANRNHGAMLELLRADVTPTGAHYLLNHFDVPVLEPAAHRLRFHGAFEAPYTLDMDEIRALPAVTQPVTMECAGNGRVAGYDQRSVSMPWTYGAVGTSSWTGAPLWPLIARARPRADVVEISFTGADEGFDKGQRHRFGRALTLAQLQELDVLLVWGMNGQPLLPQHGAPLRIIVPGWYGMASVKWLTEIEALTAPYQGFQQVETYRYRADDEDPGRPVTTIRVKSLMVPPGVPDWYSGQRCVARGPCQVMGRAWSGAGVPVTRVELGVGADWIEAQVSPGEGRYAWSHWQATWQATPGAHVLRCRATDANGHVQPLTPPWDRAGFGNNACHAVQVYVE